MEEILLKILNELKEINKKLDAPTPSSKMEITPSLIRYLATHESDEEV